MTIRTILGLLLIALAAGLIAWWSRDGIAPIEAYTALGVGGFGFLLIDFEHALEAVKTVLPWTRRNGNG